MPGQPTDCGHAELPGVCPGEPRRVPVLRGLRRFPGPAARRTGQERKVVTVLFCDLVGFTARSDKADPGQVGARLEQAVADPPTANG
jgi:class 3 adenylate cyclase